MRTYIDIVFLKEPGPEGTEFVEVEDENGRSISAGEWSMRNDGLWQLRITDDVFRNGPPLLAGSERGMKGVVCPECNGRGVKTAHDGFTKSGEDIIDEWVCPRCSGTGRLPSI